MTIELFGIKIVINERGCLLLLCLLLILALAGCDPPPKEPQPGTQLKPEQPAVEDLYQNNAGQFVTRINNDCLDNWLLGHKDCKIVALTAEASRASDSNPTDHYLIVFEKLGK